MTASNKDAIDPCGPERCRKVTLPSGAELDVPRHIVRIDMQRKRTHGWQVRFQTPSKYFADPSPDANYESLEQAKAYLRRIWEPVAKATLRGKSRKRNRPVGIWVSSEPTHLSPYRQWFVYCSHPRIQGKHRKFYFGSDATKTRGREQKAKQRALAQRKLWLEENPVPTR